MAKKAGTKTKMNTKIYDSSTNDEKENKRLVSQATTIEVFDTNVILEFLEIVKKSGKKKGETINILELGGADMKGARISRYNDKVLNKIKELGYNVRIINAEYNENAIKTAQELHGNMFINVKVDLNDNPLEALKKIQQEYLNGEKFDMVFSNYVLQHLVSPTKVVTAVKEVLSPNGLSMHRVPDDRLKVLGFYTDGKPNDVANGAATKIVEIFLKTLTRTRTDRKLGGKMFDVCTSGYESEVGATYDTVYDRVATETVPADASEEVKKTYLQRDFRWYMYALYEASEETEDAEFKKICFEAAEECKRQYQILEKEFLKKGTSYKYGEHEIVATNGLTLEVDAGNVKDIDENRKIETVNKSEHFAYLKVEV